MRPRKHLVRLLVPAKFMAIIKITESCNCPFEDFKTNNEHSYSESSFDDSNIVK